MKMTDYPDRINISPVYRQKREDDFYLVDRAAFPGKGTEYVRADLHAELEAQLSEAKEALRGCVDDLEAYARDQYGDMWFESDFESLLFPYSEVLAKLEEKE